MPAERARAITWNKWSPRTFGHVRNQPESKEIFRWSPTSCEKINQELKNSLIFKNKIIFFIIKLSKNIKTDGSKTETILCGFTPCEAYSNQILTNHIMNGTDDWFCNNCDFEIDENSYDGNGLIIRNRNAGWAGTGSEILIRLARSD